MSEHPKHDWAHALINGKNTERCTGCRTYRDSHGFDESSPCAKIVEIGAYRLVIQLADPIRADRPEATDKVLSIHVSHADGKLPAVFTDPTHDDMLGRHEQWLQLFTTD